MIAFFFQVYCTGVFQLELSMFKNINGFNIHGECCNGTTNINNQCVKSCRTFFTVCFTNYQEEISNSPTCNYGTYETAVMGNNTINFSEELPVRFENPIAFPFQFSWPVSIFNIRYYYISALATIQHKISLFHIKMYLYYSKTTIKSAWYGHVDWFSSFCTMCSWVAIICKTAPPLFPKCANQSLPH